MVASQGQKEPEKDVAEPLVVPVFVSTIGHAEKRFPCPGGNGERPCESEEAILQVPVGGI